MSTDTITSFFGLVALVCDVFVIAIAGLWLFRRRAPALWDETVELFAPNALSRWPR
jgi:hypothetical protein